VPSQNGVGSVFDPLLTVLRAIPRLIQERSVVGWRRMLGDGLRVGNGTRLSRARLVARNPAGCRCTVGSSSNIEGTIVLDRPGAVVSIGSRTHIGGRSVIEAATDISIGDDVLIAFDVFIIDHDSHSLQFEHRAHDVEAWIQGRKDWTHVATAPVRIHDKAWIAARSIILKGVSVGEGAIVGTGSVVTRDVPPWSIVAGNPARVIRESLRGAEGE